MAELAVPIPMTPRTFYPVAALPQNKTKMETIGKKYYNEIKLAETLTNVPGAIILSIIFTESAGNPSIVSSAGAVGLMQLKPQTGNDVIHLENKSKRLTAPEIELLKKHLGARVNGPLKQQYLSHKIKENNYSGNVMTRADLQKPELNILLGAMLIGILIDQHNEQGVLRLDKALVRYNQGYFFKPGTGTVEQVLDRVKGRSKEAYSYIIKVVGKNGLLETQSMV
jgi:soluble lytic murein transglycosylase-like protein